jgi:EAL domain-containing protein (putative c-di-GMP-specific phosphodiesterase class I)/GGDEF domain-containing protein
MSLMRQLWFAVVISATVAFVGSLLISVWSAQTYLSQQLERKNIDIANSLALSLTQLDKGKAMIDLQVAALFDTRHYQSISVSDSLGRVISQRTQDIPVSDVPLWFVQLFEIDSKPGVAEISASSEKYGSVQVISQIQFAYQTLWKQAENLLFWFSLGGVVVGLIAMLVLRSIGRSLDMVVEQAGAIGERRLMTIAEPRITELKFLARAMNGMVERIWILFNDEAARIEELRRRVNYDALTGLANRDYFMAHFKAQLTGTETAHCGVIALLRISDLNNINAVLGRSETDKLLLDIGQIVMNFSGHHEHALSGRIKAGEIALMLPGEGDPHKVAQQLSEILKGQVLEKWPVLSDIYQLGAVRYERASSLIDILSRVDHALSLAEGLGPNSSHALENEGQMHIMPGEQWHSLIMHAVEAGNLKLAFYPVVNRDGVILHQEAMVRLQAEAEQPLVLAGEFMPIVSHFSLSALVDLAVIRMAIHYLSTASGHVAINISAASIANWNFHSELAKLLRGKPDICSRLWLEVTEYGAFKHFDAFKDICFALKGLGCHVGIEQFGQRLAEIKKITELGLDYVKLHSTLADGIEENAANQEFIRRFCEVVHTVGVKVIAVGVNSAAELSTLKELGIDAVTGPAIGMQTISSQAEE